MCNEQVEDTYGVVCLIDSSAFEGKMEKGDFIRKANGKRIRTIEELKAACAGVPGTWFVLQVKRRSSSNPTNVVLQRCILPNGRAVAKMNAKPAQIQQTLGIEVMDKFGLVTISKISRGGPCEGHLQVLDVVSTIDGKSVLAQESLIRGAQGDVGTTFTLVCSRRGEVYTHVLERTINDDGSGRLVVRSRAVELLDDEAARAEQAMIQAEKVEAENLRQFNQRVQVSDADAASGGSDQLPTRATMPLLADPSDPGRQHVELSSTSLPSTLSDVGELESRKQDRSNNASVVGALQVGQVSSTEPQARNDLPSQISLSTPSSTPHLSATSPPAVSPLLAGQEPASGEPPSMNHEKQQQKHIQISLGISVRALPLAVLCVWFAHCFCLGHREEARVCVGASCVCARASSRCQSFHFRPSARPSSARALPLCNPTKTLQFLTLSSGICRWLTPTRLASLPWR